MTRQNGRLSLCRRGEELVTDVIQCLAENRTRVTEFRTVAPRLEDIFRK